MRCCCRRGDAISALAATSVTLSTRCTIWLACWTAHPHRCMGDAHAGDAAGAGGQCAQRADRRRHRPGAQWRHRVRGGIDEASRRQFRDRVDARRRFVMVTDAPCRRRAREGDLSTSAITVGAFRSAPRARRRSSSPMSRCRPASAWRSASSRAWSRTANSPSARWRWSSRWRCVDRFAGPDQGSRRWRGRALAAGAPRSRAPLHGRVGPEPGRHRGRGVQPKEAATVWRPLIRHHRAEGRGRGTHIAFHRKRHPPC